MLLKCTSSSVPVNKAGFDIWEDRPPQVSAHRRSGSRAACRAVVHRLGCLVVVRVGSEDAINGDDDRGHCVSRRRPPPPYAKSASVTVAAYKHPHHAPTCHSPVSADARRFIPPRTRSRCRLASSVLCSRLVSRGPHLPHLPSRR